jgi:hypothetical protein
VRTRRKRVGIEPTFRRFRAKFNGDHASREVNLARILRIRLRGVTTVPDGQMTQKSAGVSYQFHATEEPDREGLLFRASEIAYSRGNPEGADSFLDGKRERSGLTSRLCGETSTQRFSPAINKRTTIGTSFSVA